MQNTSAVQGKAPLKPIAGKQPGGKMAEKPFVHSGKKSPKPSRRPVDKCTDKAMTEAMRKKQPAGKKRAYRGGNYILYYLLGAVVVIIVLIVLSNTVLFRCGEISVSGNVRYKSEEIIEKSGLKTGDNLLHIDEKAAEDGILNSLVFIDSVDVQKAFPTKISIEVKEAERWFCVQQDGITAAVSGAGRVIEQGSFEKLAVVKGYDPESLEPGVWLKSKDEGKSSLPMEIFATAEKVGLKNITEIDITDRFSLKIVVDGRITLNLGASSEMESKLRVAQKLIETEIKKDENVTVSLSNPEKVAVKTNPAPPSSSSSSSSSSPVPPVESPESTPQESDSEETPETPDDTEIPTDEDNGGDEENGDYEDTGEYEDTGYEDGDPEYEDYDGYEDSAADDETYTEDNYYDENYPDEE